MRTIVSFFKKIFNFFLNLIIGIVFIFAFLFLTFSLLMKSNGGTFSFFGYEGRIVLSGSMVPTLPVNTLVMLNTLEDKSSYKIGDIVTFTENGNLTSDTIITHRIIDIDEINGKIFYTLKGDAVENDTQYIPCDFVIGKVVGNSLFFGRLFTFIQSKAGIIILIIIPSLAIAIFEFVRIIRLILKDDEDDSNVQKPYNPYYGGRY